MAVPVSRCTAPRQPQRFTLDNFEIGIAARSLWGGSGTRRSFFVRRSPVSGRSLYVGSRSCKEVGVWATGCGCGAQDSGSCRRQCCDVSGQRGGLGSGRGSRRRAQRGHVGRDLRTPLRWSSARGTRRWNSLGWPWCRPGRQAACMGRTGYVGTGRGGCRLEVGRGGRRQSRSGGRG